MARRRKRGRLLTGSELAGTHRELNRRKPAMFRFTHTKTSFRRGRAKVRRLLGGR